MSTLSSVREIARADSPFLLLRPRRGARWPGRSWSVSRLWSPAPKLRKSRRQLAELDERLLRDIGLDRGTARFEATKGFWA